MSYIARGVKIPFEQAIEAFVTRIYEIDDATTSFDQIAKLKTKYLSLSSIIGYLPSASLGPVYKHQYPISRLRADNEQAIGLINLY